LITSRVRLLRPATEVLVVLGISVTAFTLGSVREFRERGGAPEIPFSDARLLGTVGFELLLAALLVPFLWARGWRRSDVTADFVPRDLLRGVGLWLLAYLAYILVWMLFAALMPTVAGDVAGMRFVGAISWPVLLLAIAVNPLFEEFLFLGYTVSALNRYGMTLAATASVGLRALVHLYQGPLAVVAVAPVGTVFFLSYLRWRSLWPAVIAHMLFDAVGLAWVARAGGVA
jgi:uncharacterized protein